MSIGKEKNPPGKGELHFHKRRRELTEQVIALSNDHSPNGETIMQELTEQMSHLPSFVGQVTTPDGKYWSVALYPDDKSAIGKIRVSVREWKEKDEPLK
jgi:hypothetical protein